MALTTGEREAVWKALNRKLSALRETCPYNKYELAAAVDAADVWIENNASAYNAALPDAFRNNATAQQKALLFMYVAWKRYGSALPEEG